MKRCASHPMLEDRDQNSNGDPESAHNLPSPVPKLSLQIDPDSPASADCKTLPSRPYGGPIGPKLPCSCPLGDDAQAVQVVAARHLAPEVAGRQGSRIVGNPEVGTWTNMYGPPSDCKEKAEGEMTSLRKCIRLLVELSAPGQDELRAYLSLLVGRLSSTNSSSRFPGTPL
jgi:hypothetical protein